MAGQIDIKGMDKIKAGSDYRRAVGSARSAVYIIFALSLLTFGAIAALAMYKEGSAQFI